MRSFHFRYALLALMISTVLWGMSRGASKIERGFDIPVAFQGVPEELVLTGKSTSVINIRVLGPRSALREIDPQQMEYPVNLEGAKHGTAIYEVDETLLEMPNGARILSRSPATIELMLKRRGRKSVRIVPDLVGEPAEGFVLAEVEIEPPRVWLTGARSDVLGISEVVTETIEVDGVTESLEREVRLSLRSGHVWVEEDKPFVVRIQVDLIESEPAEETTE